MTYFFTFGLLLLTRLAQLRRPIAQVYWPVFLALYLFSAIRFEVGCDWPNYLLNYNVQQDGTFAEAMTQVNPAHWVLLEVMDVLGLPYYWLNVVTSAIFFAGLHTVARRSPEPVTVLVLAFPVLILNMPMSAVKQAAAIGLVCFALNAFSDRRPLMFLLFVGIATLFHSSAIIFLVLAPFVFGDFTQRNIMISAIMALPLLAVVLTSDAAELATTRYIQSDIDAGGAIFRIGLLIATGILFFTMLARKWAREMPDSYALMALLCGGMIALGPVLLASTVIADRFGYYLAVPALLVYAALPTLLPGKRMQLVRAAPYVALTVVLLGWTQLSNHFAYCYQPYSIILGEY